MAKTIEQLAEEYYNGITSSNQDFIDGANAVLQEVDKVLAYIRMNDIMEPHYILMMLNNMIQQLRSE